MSSPKLRFKEFSEDWKHSKVENHYYNLPTNSFSRSCLNYEFGSVKNIHYGDIHVKFKSHFDVKNETVPFINEDVNYKRYGNESFCLEKDLVFADASEDLNDIGKCIEIVNTNNENILCGLHTIHLRNINNNLFKGFSGFLFRTENIIKQIQKESQGAKVLGISSKKILNININLPTLLEQEKIATFFATVDKKLNLLKEKKEKLELYKKGVMQQIFSQKLRFKDEKENEFAEWEEKKLGEVAHRITFKNKEDNQNVLTISAQQGLISQLEYFNKSVSAKNLTNYYLIEKDDFAYNKSYSKGYPMGAIKRLKRYDKGVVSTLYICFRFDKDQINLTFMEQLFEEGKHIKELENITQEGARNHGLLNIALSDFFNINLNIPSLPEQEKIAQFLSTLDAKINLVETQIQKTELWKKGLLQQMFV